MFGVGGGEILVIALVAVILFGTDDLPKNMRKFMKAWNNFRGVTNDLQRGWLDVRDQVTRDILTERPEQPKESTQQLQADHETSVTASEDDATQQVELESGSSPTDQQSIESDPGADAPKVRPAVGAIAQGQIDETNSEQFNELTNSSAGPDKST